MAKKMPGSIYEAAGIALLGTGALLIASWPIALLAGASWAGSLFFLGFTTLLFSTVILVGAVAMEQA